MTELAELENTARAFMLALQRSTDGSPEAQVSMYAIGETLGLDREASATAAEDLIARGLVEIRTLAGGIGLTETGVDMLANGQDRDDQGPRLGNASPLASARRDLVDQMLTGIKVDLSRSGLPFEALAEITADIRTIESQLASPKPKTAIVRECFRSIMTTAAANRQTAWEQRLDAFLR